MSSRRALAAFLALTFAIDWGLIAGFLALGGQWERPWSTVMPGVFMFGPAVAAIVVQRGLRRRPVAELGLRWRPSRWWTVAWLGPFAVLLATMGIDSPLREVSFEPSMAGWLARFEGLLDAEQLTEINRQIEALPVSPFWIMLALALIAGPTAYAVFGLGEELGWRGLMHELVEPLGFWRGSALIGLVWGLWHAPLVLLGHNTAGDPEVGVLVTIFWTTLVSPAFAWVRNKTGSAVAAGVMHGSLNAAAGLALMQTGGSERTLAVAGLTGVVMLVLVNLAIFGAQRVERARRAERSAKPSPHPL